MGESVLVVGGTGPTGLPLLRGLVARGHDVTILHRGLHEHDETPEEVAHLHADPYDVDSFVAGIGARTFDTTIVMYGRLRRIAEAGHERVDVVRIGVQMGDLLRRLVVLVQTSVQDRDIVATPDEAAQQWQPGRTGAADNQNTLPHA